MHNSKSILIRWLLISGVFAVAWLGLVVQNWGIVAIAAGGLVYVMARSKCTRAAAGVENKPPIPSETRPPAREKEPTSNDPGDLVRQMMRQGRYPLLLRKQIAANLEAHQVAQATDALEEDMALTPAGEVLLRPPHSGPEVGDSAENPTGRLVRVELVYLDRYPVTNREFYEFVAAGGYGEMALWEQEILPGLLDFVDRSGLPGPRFWRDGTYPEGQDDRPVVGINWYEASAYARWIGKRLPTDPEWVKAACWPVTVPGALPLQRKYPWGDSMDRSLANIWGSGPGQIVPVTQFTGGMSVGGVYGLIGNVWEWTATPFGTWHESQARFETAVPMRSIRGGAFDTYFDNQATCQFQSGESPVGRKHNIGFRCAVGACDLTPRQAASTSTQPEEAVAELAMASGQGSQRL